MMIKVGMADMQMAQAPVRLKTMGLGSCVGVTLYDPTTRAGAMAHVMLPSSDISRDGVKNLAKYADTAIPEMVRLMETIGAKRRNLIAKMAGGAQMFIFNTGQDQLRIGFRNVEACAKALALFSIPIISQETGGTTGRTIELDISTGFLHIWSINREVKVI